MSPSADSSPSSKWYSLPKVVKRYDSERFGRKGGKITDTIERKTVKKLLSNFKGKKVLDVATGKGRLAQDLVNHGAQVTGIDASRPMLQEAWKKVKNTAAARQGRINFEQGDCKQLKFSDNEFDCVTALRFIHLTKDPMPYLQEMVRVAKERVVFDIFSLHSLRILYNPLLQMGSHLHRASKILSILDQLEVKRVKLARRFAVPFGALRLARNEVADILEQVDYSLNRHYNKFCSVIYFKAELV